jgi:hypothetical protein
MTRQRQLATLARWSGLIAITVAVLAGCGSKEGHDKPGGGKDPVAGALNPETTAGAIVIGVNGEVRVIDRNGQAVAPCVLPAAGKDTGLPECPKVRDTTIIDAQPISIVRHTGSQCFIVGTVSAGRYVQYSVCVP